MYRHDTIDDIIICDAVHMILHIWHCTHHYIHIKLFMMLYTTSTQYDSVCNRHTTQHNNIQTVHDSVHKLIQPAHKITPHCTKCAAFSTRITFTGTPPTCMFLHNIVNVLNKETTTTTLSTPPPTRQYQHNTTIPCHTNPLPRHKEVRPACNPPYWVWVRQVTNRLATN